MEHNDLLQCINASYKTMSKGQKQIAQYILENYDKAAFITASKMGSLVGVSESTVVRFAYALGYDGYPALQRSLQELIRNKLTSVQRIQLTEDIQEGDVLKTVLKADMHNIRATIENVDEQAFNKVVTGLLSAKRVYVLGQRSSTPLAEFFGYYLNFVLDNVRIVTAGTGDIFEQMIRIEDGDVCIGISFPRYSTRTVEGMKFAKGKGARVFAITDGLISPLAECAEEVLIARSDMASFADSLVAPLSLINAIIVALSIRRKDEVSQRFNQLEAIWDKQKVYIGKNGN
jgi:DNA-binding MurR/RpiR family transcriptional regulator